MDGQLKGTSMKELIVLLQKALTQEHQAYIQYLSHAVVLRGPTTPGVAAQLEDNAKDEAAHADILRDLLSNYLDVYPTMDVAEPTKAIVLEKILVADLKSEKEAIATYKEIMKLLEENKDMEDYYSFWTKIENILVEEEQHVRELEALQ